MDPTVIAAMPPATLAAMPAAAPPPGVTPNFVHRPTLVPQILGLTFTFLAIASVCYVIRIWTKLFIVKRWQWDDFTITLGFIGSILHLIFVVRGSLYGGTGKHEWDVSVAQALSRASLQQSVATVMIITPTLGLIKMTLFIQYYMLFKVRRYIRISVWVGVSVFGLYFVAVTITAFILSSPWPGETPLETVFSKHYLTFDQFAEPTGVIGMLLDFYLLILPIPAVLGLHMSTRKKMGILLIFATGGLAAVASVISLYYRVIIQRNLSDVTWKVGYVLLWSEIEMYAGVTASSMTTVRQFFTYQEWDSSLKRSLPGTTAPSSQGELPPHVATLREWHPSSTITARSQDEKLIHKDSKPGKHSQTELYPSSLMINPGSLSIKSTRADSF